VVGFNDFKQQKRTNKNPKPQKTPRTFFPQPVAHAAVLNASVAVENKLNEAEFDKPKSRAVRCASRRMREVGS